MVPQPIVPDPMPVAELIALGILHRPELAAQRAAIQAALMSLDGAKILPFSPTTLVGFSAGGFGGGSNLVRPIFGGLGGRTDLDAIVFWTIQNLGVGNIAMIRMANAQLSVTQFHRLRSSIGCAPMSPKPTRDPRPIRADRHLRRGGPIRYLAYHQDLDRTGPWPPTSRATCCRSSC